MDERETRAALAMAIDSRRHKIEQRWLESVQADMRVSHVEPTDLRHGIQRYLALVVVALRSEDPGHRALHVWREVAHEHALTRVRLGFDVEQLVRELTLLRRTVVRVLHDDEVAITAESVEAVADVIDAAIAASLKSYVDARDYGARREHAEHLGFLSHELRTPLAAAALSTNMLRRMGSLPEQQERVLARIEQGLKRAQSLTEEVLLAERLEAGKVESQPADTTLGAVIDDIVDNCRQAAEIKGCGVKASYEPSLRVHIDPKLTRSVVENLLENAVKYTDRGLVELVVEDNPAELVFHVRDSCPGLSEAELRIIFEPFRRGRTQKPGTGLGLSIARRAVEAQGGRICAESGSESGCHFWFHLPKRPPP